MPPPFPGRVSGFDRAGDDWLFAGISFCGRCQICGELPAGSWKAEKPGGIEALPAAKGISREIIREQLEETEHDSGEAIRVLLEKKHYRAGETAPEEEKKIIAYLMRRGFSWEDIRREMKEQEDALG